MTRSLKGMIYIKKTDQKRLKLRGHIIYDVIGIGLIQQQGLKVFIEDYLYSFTH